MENVKKHSKIIGWVGCAIMFIAVFLPFATTNVFGLSVNVNFIEGDGTFVLIASIITAILIFFNKAKLSLISTAVALFVTLYDGINVLSDGEGLVSLGIGFYLIIIGVILSGVYAFTFKEEKKN